MLRCHAVARTALSRGLATVAPRDPKMQGCLVNLVTPFKPGTTEIDYPTLEKHVERQVAAGVSGVIPLGTTGECFAVSYEEHRSVVKCVADVVAGRCHVVPGTAQPSTEDTIKYTRSAKEMGATACLTATPYFNKPSQEGIFQHYAALGAVGLPIVLYNVPGRTNGFATPATLQRIFEAVPELIAVKEATANMDVATEIHKRCAGGLTLLSGDDSLALPLASVGGRGVMSVASNLVPDEMVDLVSKANSGDFAGALQAQVRLFPLFQSMVAEVNPVPVKVGMVRSSGAPTLDHPAAHLSCRHACSSLSIVERSRPCVDRSCSGCAPPTCGYRSCARPTRRRPWCATRSWPWASSEGAPARGGCAPHGLTQAEARAAPSEESADGICGEERQGQEGLRSRVKPSTEDCVAHVGSAMASACYRPGLLSYLLLYWYSLSVQKTEGVG